MKILLFSTVYNHIKRLKALQKFAQDISDLEVVVCAGNILGQCLGQEDVATMGKAYNFIIRTVRTQESISFKEILERLKNQNELSEHKKAAEDYLEIEAKFDKIAAEQYETQREIFKEFPPDPSSVFIVPGSLDSINFLDHLGYFSLHPKNSNNSVEEVNGIEFAGYGGGTFVSPFLPPTRKINFLPPSLYEYLTEKDPDVAVTNINPYGFTGGYVETPDFASLAYIIKYQPDLFLCGSSSIPNVRQEGKTAIVNPGHLHSGEHGTFLVIDTLVDDDRLKVKCVQGYKIGADENITKGDMHYLEKNK